MSNQGQGLLSHFYLGFLYVVCLYKAQISGERFSGPLVLWLFNILRTIILIETKFCIHIFIDKIYVGIVNHHFCPLIAP